MENLMHNEFAKGSIAKLLMKFSIPCILSLLVSSLYNLVDQMFIGWGIGYLGNGATNVVFPITIIALAVSLLIGDGCAAYLSICQGQNNKEKAHHSFGNSIVLLIISGIILMILFFALKENILWTFGATENNITYAREYFDIITIGIPFYVFVNGINAMIRADGSPKFAMISTLIGCILNVILDPIAIFALKWGMFGAALATIIGQIVSCLISVIYLFHTKTVKLNKDSFKLSFNLIKHFLPLGISSFLTQLSIVIIMGAMNSTLVKYGFTSKYGEDIPMTVMGIVMKVFQIAISFVVGFAVGAQPIVGYNYGAGNYDRVKKTYKIVLIFEIIVGIISTLLFELIPVQIISIFGSGDELYNEFARLSFQIYLSTMILCCIQKASSIFLQSLGKPIMSMSLSLLRDFILSLPLIIILPIFNLGVIGPLFSAPIADIISFIVTVVFIKITFNKMKK